jgi:RNA polymerase sigma factor (sigma-70 family)
MVDTSGPDRDGTRLVGAGKAVTDDQLRDWFIREVLPMEAALTQFLRRTWRNQSEIGDLCQDTYIKVYEAARKEIPKATRPFVLSIARNIVIDRIRHEQVVPIETVSDLDTLNIANDQPGPERVVSAREELRKLQAALDRLPPRCREAIVLKKIEGLTTREIAVRMNIAVRTVDCHLSDAAVMLSDLINGYSGPDGGGL